MLVSLITKARHHTFQLPQWRDGHFMLTDPRSGEELFDIVGTGAGWQIYPCGSNQLSGDAGILADGQLLRARLGASMEKAILYVEKRSPQYARFGRCLVGDTVTFKIGTGPDADIRLKSPVISPVHCTLTSVNRQWRVTSLDRKLGVFVNGQRVMQALLKPGDTVCVMHQKFIVLPGMLAMNGQNLIKESLRGKITPLHIEPVEEDRIVGRAPSPSFFHRAPRFTNGLFEKNVDVDAPPTPVVQTRRDPSLDRKDDSDGLLTYGPAIMSGAAMLLGGMANPITGIGMLVSSLLFPSLRKKKQQEAADLRREEYEKQREEEIREEQKRRQLYDQYLRRVDRELDEINRKQTQQLLKFNPSVQQEIEELRKSRATLWNRRPEHGDFLDIRLGTGNMPVRANVNFPDEAYIAKDDPLRESLRAVREKERMLRGVPMMLQLSRFYSVGVSGTRDVTVPMIARMILQLAIHIGYDDLKLCILGKLPKELRQLRWLPHTWNDENTVHMVAENKEELTDLLPELDKELSFHRPQGRSTDAGPASRSMVFLILDKELAGSGMVSRLLFDHPRDQVHVISMASHSRYLPQRTDLAIGLFKDSGRVIWQDGDRRSSMDFRPDPDVLPMLGPMAELMANTRLDLRQEMARMPDVVPFLDMFGVQDIARLNIMNRWLRSDPIRSLAAPIGVSEDGNLCMLDLHERGDGPHGLIAGTTGSGKSEMLMNYILSMAVNYSPREVSFVLIDYKGGGMAKAFEKLPHTAGIITNLDGNEIKRSLQSIESELERRLRIFSKCQKKLGMRNIDIYKYQQLFRDREIAEPLSHLIIIADEFAELKTQQPEFLDQLTRAARIGRSLGVHLILATQKPGGIVDEQIRSNSNFRICLRVQTPADSRELLMCEDAAYLTRVGSLFKQVGYGEVLLKAQSGWTGADYTPDRINLPNAGVDVLDFMGSVLRHVDMSHGQKSSMSQMEACIAYIADMVKNTGMRAERLWEPSLEKKISLAALRRKYQPADEPRILQPVLGEADDPARQRRYLLRPDLSCGKNTLLYGSPGSGDVMALGTILEDLLLHHTADEMQIYIADCADDGLGIYRQAPQVGDVIGSSDEEKLQRLLQMLEEQIRIRKKFLGGAVDSEPLSVRLARSGMGHILLVIHHIIAFQDLTQLWAERFKSVMKEGPRYGISFFATQEAATGLRYQYEQEFSQKYTLQLDSGDYYSVVGRTDGFVPAAVTGRGMYRGPAPENMLYEFQTASADHPPRDLCAELSRNWSGPCAEPIRTLPDQLTSAELAPGLRPAAPWRIPAALNTHSLRSEYIDLAFPYIHIALGKPQQLAQTFNGIAALAHKNNVRTVALDPTDLMDPLPDGGNIGPDAAGAKVKEMLAYCQAVRKQLDSGAEPEQGAPTLFLIPDLRALLNILNEEDRTALETMMAGIREIWGWRFLIGGTPGMMQGQQYTKWFTQCASRDNGLYMGKGLRDNGVLDYDSAPNENIEYPMGYIIRDKEVTKVQFVQESGKGGWDEWNG